MRRPSFRLLLSLGVVVTLVVSAHFYFAARFIHDAGLSAPWKTIGNAAIALAGGLIFIHPFMQLRAGPRLSRALAWPTYVWLAACFYLLLGLGISDFVLWIAGLHGEHVSRV